MIALLPTLYSEYYDLSSKLQKISDLITSYGGDLPIQVKDVVNAPEQPTPAATVTKVIPVIPAGNIVVTDSEYPQNESWRQKLLYSLSRFGKPITAKELAQHIFQAEGSGNRQHIINTTAQYLSKLEKEKRIDADKSFRPTKYFLIS